MAETIGTVEWIKVAEGIGLVAVRDRTSNRLELFIIWWSGNEETQSAFARVVQSIQVSLIEKAMEHRAPIVVLHDDQSAYISSLRLDAF